MITCPNNVCGKVFQKPIKALNLQHDTEGPYDACPHCLTEITLNDETSVDFNGSETLGAETVEPETLDSEVSVEAEPETEELKPEDEKVETAEVSSECAHFLGYLSEKSSSDKIPDECMMCKDIVTCMLKKMNT